MTMAKSVDDLASDVSKISRQIQPLLHGHSPYVQCAVLADLLSMWLAGHWPPEAREKLLTDFADLARDLVPISERQIFGPFGHPAGREKP
jgi:hypothetical protein